MGFFFNPAAGLTANRVPYALGGGRLGDDPSFTFSATGVLSAKSGQFTNAIAPASGLGLELGVSAGVPYVIGFNRSVPGAVSMSLQHSGGRVLVGTQTDYGNGKLQLNSHTVPDGGFGFFDFSLYRDGAASARMNAALRAVSLATDAGGDINTGGDIRLGTNSGGTDRWIYDRSGNVILKNRSAVNPVTLADVITILKYHGLCA